MTQNAPAPTRRRRLWLGLATLGLGTGLALGLTELALQLTQPAALDNPIRCLAGFYRLDAQDRIETTPGWRGVQPVDGRPIAVRTNQLGMRGPELGPKRSGEQRILMVGDSFVWGMGVDESESIPARLEQRLRAAGRTVTVGNAGMWGTSPREWGYTVDRMRPEFAPDAIVAVLYLGNDLSDLTLPPLYVVDGLPANSDLAHAAQTSWRWKLALRSRLWMALEHRLLNRWFPIAVPPQPRFLPPGVSPLEGVFFDLDPALPSAPDLLDAFTAHLRTQFADLQRAAAGLPVLVVVLPSHEVALKPYADVVRSTLPTLDPAWFRRGNGGRRLQQLAAAFGFAARDLDADFAREADPKPWFLPQDWHFSPQGCAQVADWLLPDVTALLGR